jgi:hypothetical protein
VVGMLRDEKPIRMADLIATAHPRSFGRKA